MGNKILDEKAELVSKTNELIDAQLKRVFDINSPLSELTLWLLQIEDKTNLGICLQIIESKFNLKIGEYKNLLETLGIFADQYKFSEIEALYTELFHTENLNKFSKIFLSGGFVQKKIIEIIHKSGKRIFTENLENPEKLFRIQSVIFSGDPELFDEFIRNKSVLMDETVICNSISENYKKEVGREKILTELISDKKSLSQKAASKRLKIAMCVSGQLRGYKLAVKYYEKLGLEIHDVDIYVDVWKSVSGAFPTFGQAARIFKNSDYLKEFSGAFRLLISSKSEKLIMDRYPNLMQAIIRSTEVSKTELINLYKTTFVNIEDDSSDFFCSMPAIVKMHYKLERCFTQVESSGKYYDLIIRTRPDLCLKSLENTDWYYVLSQSYKKNCVFVDFSLQLNKKLNAESFIPFECGDIFAVGTFDQMSIYMKSLSHMIKMQKRGVVNMLSGVMPHFSLARVLMYYGIQPLKFPFGEINGLNIVEENYINTESLLNALREDTKARIMDEFDKLLIGATIKDLNS